MSSSNVRRHTPRVSSLKAAAIGLVVLLAICYAVFGGSLPFGSSPFLLKAVFTANTDLHIPSPVRIAGVQVGEVTGVERIKGSANAGLVIMQIDKNGLPLHADATADIRSRIFLEGNFYVDLEPGTPEAPILRSGATLPAANTAGPVQLDRILSSLNSNSRANLQKLVQGLGASLNTPPTAAQKRGQDQSDAGLTGAQGLNYALNYSAKAFETSAIVNQALLGERPTDLAGVVKGESEVFKGLAASGEALPQLVDNFEQTMAALAVKQDDLSSAIAVLPAVLKATDHADAALSASFAPTERFASELIPGIKQLAPTITVAVPWLKQLTALSSQTELGGLLKYLTPAVANTSTALTSTASLISQANELSQCFSKVLVPTGNETITQDSSPPTGLQIYQQLFQSAVGLDSATQNFDGNGRYLRATVGGGSNQVKSAALSNGGPLYGNAVLPLSGTLPAFPSSQKAPTLDSKVPCYTQTAPDLNTASQGGTP
jgi:phospholipid/cholesterol/gamma-HCH transport system substrate-binding protein